MSNIYRSSDESRHRPAELSASVPDALIGQLVFYSNGWVSLLAPREGWSCSAVVGADGSYSMSLKPIGQTSTDYTQRQISAQFAFNGPGASLACPYFPEAIRGYSFPCGVQIRAKESSARLSAQSIAVEDPPLVLGTVPGSGGAYPANGVLTFHEPGTAAAEATCTLPPIEHLVCTTILNDFLARYPPKMRQATRNPSCLRGIASNWESS